ncbi:MULTISPECIES: acyl-CoA dehydrogenase family protein [Pseudomonas]|jgi:alkylation response protein AidB-like acyl-CoA dehydrogenase|uniref:Acyl-CoA dehydrogenase n=1 Tax=Pseudomonas psychrophila TaxID=122355 RepID=A0ABY0VU95_9PSED|nr:MULTISPECIES: acyl-CoA dehydrogenase family protein [Pseudomonas]EPJ91309.1 acyl-CoA dehydrogenase domain-containing protein [Pseudomonas psychrophila]KAB0489510.1 acyl-CoA dehydrogenase [Pseudomonas psychrophila]KMM98815.1 acyl-CoA dehydrogenase [Pseudomonas psychrophila]KOX65134.1 acyl-CoA dehydrogenase [Pseudomonas psychrophila]MDY7584851.1 acyl-CoA dehydrogenase family protein [Pseudomonas sp. CCI3.1]
MNIGFSAADEQFRQQVAQWMQKHLTGEFAVLRFRGGPGDEDFAPELRKRWEQVLAQGKWVGAGWAIEQGGRGLSINQQVIFFEEYARAGGPGRMGHIGEGLVGPTIAAFGTPEQQQRFLPPILSGQDFWCQGYSEPGAGSDLANIKTRANFDEAGEQWLISGQKVWTSLAHESDWCFVLARTEPGSVGHRGLSFLLVKMDQPGIRVQPIQQLTGTCEFNEVFFDQARTSAHNMIGQPGDGWKIAMALLGFERGVSTLGQQMQFQNELDEVVRIAKTNGAAQDPVMRQRIAQAWSGLRVLRYNSLRMLSGVQDGSLRPEATIYKLAWSTWHVELGKLAMDVLGPEAELLAGAPYELTRLQALFLFTRADTLYGGSNEIQRNIIAERALGMPREPR